MNPIKIFIAAMLCFTFAMARASAPDPAVANLIKTYLDIKNALTNDDGKAAGIVARQFTDAVKAVNNATLSPSQKVVWTKYAEKLRYNSEHIGESNDIEHQREHFVKLSDDIYAVIKGMKANDMTLYREYCPMKKGYWLSQTSDIRNPYYGKEMLDCGTVKETLSPAK